MLLGGISLDDLQVLDEARAAKVEDVFSGSTVPGAASLPLTYMRQTVLNWYSFAESFSTRFTFGHHAKLFLKSFVRHDVYSTPAALRRWLPQPP